LYNISIEVYRLKGPHSKLAQHNPILFSMRIWGLQNIDPDGRSKGIATAYSKTSTYDNLPAL